MDGDVKAIPLAGIVHNETKIGVQDGMLEDLVNMRFKDGSWRTSDPGNSISLPSSADGFSQFYIHTNVYRHLLGVKNGGLYWIAIIDADGKFYIGNSDEDDTPEHTTAHEVFYGEGDTYNPVLITEVTGEVKITQTGHLITVIDEEDDFEFFVYKTSEKKYIEVNVDVNGKQSDRNLYPFGDIHFNWYSAEDEGHVKGIRPDLVEEVNGSNVTRLLPYEHVVAGYKVLTDHNKFVHPMLAIAAIELYDGSYIYASNSVLIFPTEQATLLPENYAYINLTDIIMDEDETEETGYKVHFVSRSNLFFMPEDVSAWANNQEQEDDGTYSPLKNGAVREKYAPYSSVITPNYNAQGSRQVEVSTSSDGASKSVVSTTNLDMVSPSYSYPSAYRVTGSIYQNGSHTLDRRAAFVRGYDLVMSLQDKDILTKNRGVFSALCVFVTNPVCSHELDEKKYEVDTRIGSVSWRHNGISSVYEVSSNVTIPKVRAKDDIIFDLVHSPFYLLKRYDSASISDIIANPIIDLSGREDEGLLANIVQQQTLQTESLGRMTYLPKVTYNYNGRLHFANYKSMQFHGYPLDLFQVHNHSVKYHDGETYKGLENLEDNRDEYIQFERATHTFYSDAQVLDANAAAVWSIVEIETESGTQKVCRYIPAKSGLALEDLNQMLSFPDYRAKKLTIYYITDADCHILRRVFDLKPHPYLNLAYYINPTLAPIKWDDTSSWDNTMPSVHPEDIADLLVEENESELFPNGLKVSSAEDPMYFPAKNTYQVGSAEILALCSNTIAVGTGQTGDAPLYIFCKDGIYALFVDASGQMVYPNARAIARDVLNNPKSVTPIDTGVVFTTERGLMMIAGEQVQEIGQPLEGDYNHFIDADNMIEYNAIAKNAYTLELLAGLADNTATQTDFLTFLKGSVLNYNHNEWELMVSNPAFQYTYILDKHGNWSRRNYSAEEYINNYPSSYRFAGGTTFWQVDKESDADTDNGIFIMTREIKLDSIGFKSLQRVVARGFYSVPEVEVEGELRPACLGLYVFGSHDSRKWACLGHRERPGTFTDIGCLVERTDCKFFRVVLAGRLKKESRLDYIEISSKPSVLNTKIR